MPRSKKTIQGYTRHPASAALPDHSPDEYDTLLASIQAQGQNDPIRVTPDKRVFDGWHRLMAVDAAGETVKATTCFFSEEEIARDVIGAHEGRRHMTKADMAAANVRVKRACGLQFAEPGDRQDTKGKITRKDVAREAGVSERVAQRAITDAKRDEGLIPEREDPPAEMPERAPEAEGSTEETPPSASGEPERTAEPEKDPAPAETPEEPPAPAEETEEAPPAARSEPESEEEAEPDPLEVVTAERDEALATVEELNVQIATRDAHLSDEERTRLEAANSDAALIRTLKSRVNELQSKTAEQQRTIKALRMQRTRRDKQIENLKAEIETLKGESA